MKAQLFFFLIACFAAMGSGQGGLGVSKKPRTRSSSSSTSSSPSTSRLTLSSSSFPSSARVPTPSSSSTTSMRSSVTSSMRSSVTSSMRSSVTSSSMRSSVTSSSSDQFFSIISVSTSAGIPQSNSTSPLIVPLASGIGGKDPTGLTEGAIVGIVVGVGLIGGAILIAAIIGFVLWMTRRKRHQQESKPVAATVANDYQYEEFSRPVQRLPSEHQYAIIDETDTRSVNGGFMTSQYDNVSSTSQTNNQVSGVSNEAMTSVTDAPVDPDSRGSISEVTLVENTFYG